MEGILSIIAFVKSNLKEIIDTVAYLIAGASVIVKLTPTLKDDAYLKTVIKFIGKFIALDKYGPKGDGA